MTEKTQTTQTTADQQLTILHRIDHKVDDLDKKLNQIHRDSMRAGAIAGGVAGGVTGGIVTLSVAFIKAKLGL